MDWKHPFRLAFELALTGIGWILVALVSFLIFAVVYAIFKSAVQMVTKKKKSEEPKTSGLKVVKD